MPDQTPDPVAPEPHEMPVDDTRPEADSDAPSEGVPDDGVEN